MTTIPDFARRAAEREFPCVCLDDFTERGRVDPQCRHDDMQHALEAAWSAANPPPCCERCRTEWDGQATADGVPWSVIMSRPMFVCPDCGDKRCPKAHDHRDTCQHAR